jgi:hypothetical protein
VLVLLSFLVLNIKADDALYADLAEPIAVLKIGIIMQEKENSATLANEWAARSYN